MVLAIAASDDRSMEENRDAQSPPPQSAVGQTAPGTIKRLTRSRHDKMVAGVAGGFGRYFAVDPLLFRIGFVALAIAGGSGFLVYLACWFLLPQGDGGPSSGGSSRGPRAGLLKLLGAIILVALAFSLLGGIFFAGHFDLGFPGLFVALALIAIGYLLLREEEPVVATDVEAAYGRASASGVSSTISPAGEPAEDMVMLETPRRPRERSPLGWLGLGVAFLVVSAALAMNKGEFTNLEAGQVGGLFVLAIGVAVLVGAWWGRARWLVPLGLLFVPVAMLLAMIDVPLRGSVGDFHLLARDDADLQGIEMLAGELTVDLTQYDFDADRIADLSLTFVVGTVTVIVPDDASVDATAELVGGEVFLFNGYDRGVEISSTASRGGSAAPGQIDITIDGGFGEVFVTTESNSDFTDRAGSPWRRRD